MSNLFDPHFQAQDSSGKTYQSSRGPVIATANGFQPAGAASRPSARQSRSERFTNLDQFGMIS